MADLTRTSEGSRLVVDVSKTTVKIDTREKRHLVLDADDGATVEVVLADNEFAPSVVLVDGMSLWTS